MTLHPANTSRFQTESSNGFYESYFLRANHPTRPLAFWLRYTVFRPEGQREGACGELWAIWFDGENDRISAVKEAVPIAQCAFSRQQLEVRLGEATLTPGAALAAVPNAVFTGMLDVDGVEIPIEGWQGSQNHNWGSRHTDRYAWGQVAGFDNAPDAFLECATAQVKVGPLWTPRMTFVVLREEGQETALNGLMQAMRSSGHCEFFTWALDARGPDVRIHGRIQAPAKAFVGLSYRNPPGGAKTCLNTKLASAEITVERPGQPARVLKTAHRAAFEILTDRSDHGVPIVA